MSDHRDDEPTSGPPEDAPPPPDEAGVTPAGDDSFEIQEMTPPPPGERDATSAMPTPPPGADGEGASAPPPPPPAGAAPEPPSAPNAAASGPPAGIPPASGGESGDGGSRPWPSSAKAVVAVLVVLVLAGIAGTVIGFTRASSAEDDIDATSGDLAAERERADTAEAEVEELGESLIAVTQERDELAAERDELVAERDELAAERDELAAERDEAIAVGEAEQARLEGEIVELEERIVELEDELADVGDVDELFPLSLQLDLGEIDIAGTYAVSLTEVACSGLDGLCGSAPGLDDATISDGLRLTIPDTLDVPLTVVDGTPFGPADSESIVPPCGDDPRSASLTMALFGDGVEIDAAGDAEVTALGATIVIDAPATEECDIGRAWYRAELTPR